VVGMIDALVQSTGTADREDFFLTANWGGICVNANKERPAVIANVAAQKAAADRLVTAFTRNTLQVFS
ncbi:hypothetical protein L7G46_06070, partial [Klebsiella pneumoniae]